MYLSQPKDLYDVGTSVAPEEKNIVDMPAMNFCFQFEAFSWMVLCTVEISESCMAEKCSQQTSINSTTGRINGARISTMI